MKFGYSIEYTGKPWTEITQEKVLVFLSDLNCLSLLIVAEGVIEQK